MAGRTFGERGINQLRIYLVGFESDDGKRMAGNEEKSRLKPLFYIVD